MSRKLIMVAFLLLIAGNAFSQQSPASQMRSSQTWYKKAAFYAMLFLGGGTVVAFAALPVLRRTVFKSPNEQTVSELLPFDKILDDQVTIRAKDGSLHQLICVKGLDYSGKTEKDEVAVFLNRYSFFKTVCGKGVFFKILSLRERINKTAHAEYDNITLQEIHDKWMRNFERSFINTTYILLSTKKKIKKTSIKLKKSITAN